MAKRRAHARVAVYPFRRGGGEYQRYRDSEAYQRDGAFWAEQRKQLPSPVSLSSAPLPGRAATTDILRLKVTADRRAFTRLAQAAGPVQRTDLALALVALWIGRLTGRLDYAAGFIFMRRMGSAALTATGPVLNVLPLAVNIAPHESLPALAHRLAHQLKKCVAISVMTPSRSCATADVPRAMTRCLARY